MNDKQKRFCQEYVVDLNGTKAAIRAGYSEKSAQVTASRLLNEPIVLHKITELQAELAQRTGITVERVLQEYEKLAFANMQDYIQVQQDGSAFLDLSKLTRDQAAAIATLNIDEETETLDDEEAEEIGVGKLQRVRKIRIKLADKKGALDSIAKHLGMFLDKEQSPDKGMYRFAGTMEELLALYRQITSKTQHA